MTGAKTGFQTVEFIKRQTLATRAGCMIRISMLIHPTQTCACWSAAGSQSMAHCCLMLVMLVYGVVVIRSDWQSRLAWSPTVRCLSSLAPVNLFVQGAEAEGRCMRNLSTVSNHRHGVPNHTVFTKMVQMGPSLQTCQGG